MYNSETPSRAELPSSRQLVRSTILAAATALALLVAVVLPAEYGIDPTGVGRVLRLTQMGEIKASLAAEAAADSAGSAAAPGNQTPTIAPADVQAAPGTQQARSVEAPAAPAAPQQPAWRDEMTFTLKPGEGIEIKLRMKEGEKAFYAWAVNGGAVNYDTHGDGGGRSISYEKGRSVAADEGELVAAFAGNHGWFWRNRGKASVEVVLRTRGQYSDIKRTV